MTKRQLKPCPFCGSDAQYRIGWLYLYTQPPTVKYHRVQCINGICNVFINGMSKADVYKLWNRRRYVEFEYNGEWINTWGK